MVTVAFSASGYRTSTMAYRNEADAREAIKVDSAGVAEEHGGEVVDYGNGEWVVNAPGGEEIARWELLGSRPKK